MSYVRRFFRFWWDFIVGDDWRIAAGVAVALGLTALLVGLGVTAWWVMPAAAILLLVGSTWRRATATGSSRPQGAERPCGYVAPARSKPPVSSFEGRSVACVLTDLWGASSGLDRIRVLSSKSNRRDRS
jgi:hypothetical protein